MGFHPDFTGRENARMNAALLGLNGPEIRRRLPEIRDFAELGDFFDRPVRTYSSGMVLRLAFAVATHADAEVLIVDEALAVGDGYFQKKSVDRITEFHRRGGTLLFCSHALYYVALLCDQAIWLKNGEVAAQGSALPVVRALRGLPAGEGAVPDPRSPRRPRSAAAATEGRRPARLTEVVVHDGSGYARTEFAAGETVAVDVAFETADPGLAFQVRIGVDREDGVQIFAVDTRHEPWAPLTGRSTIPPAPRAAGAAARAGRVPRLRLPRRRGRPPRSRRADPEARLFGRGLGVRRRPPAAAARLDVPGARRRGVEPGGPDRRLVLTRSLAFRSGPRAPGLRAIGSGGCAGAARRAPRPRSSGDARPAPRASPLRRPGSSCGDGTAIPAGEVPEPPPGGLAVGRPASVAAGGRRAHAPGARRDDALGARMARGSPSRSAPPISRPPPRMKPSKYYLKGYLAPTPPGGASTSP